MNKNNLFELNDITFNYQLGSQTVEALKGVSLTIPQESLVLFSGPSGSGKSTLLNILGLIEPVQEGTLLFNERCLVSMGESEKNVIRKFQIGFIFQQFHLIPVLSAEENVAYFLQRQKLSPKEIKERVEESLQSVGLWEHRKKKPGELSGGQMQRVAIARAIAKHPSVIIGDEPTASLDQKTGREIMTIFEGLVKEKNLTIILTSHDPMVQEFAEVNFHVQDGLLVN